MKLTTRGRYAVTAMLDLALHQDQGPIALADIAERQGISLSYLEQLFGRLRKAGLVKSTRGPGGGYHLAGDRHDISVALVIDAVSENVDATRCGGAQNCHGEHRCLTHDLWEDLSNRIRDYLDTVSLGALVERKSVQTVRAQQEGRRTGEGATEHTIAFAARPPAV